MQSNIAITLIRNIVGILLGIHGIARVSLGIVDDFGGFLSQAGFPIGAAIAWGITLFEIAGAGLLVLGRFIVPVASIFILELMMGIVMVHAREGWFVVGAGRNGVEYSVLLIACLAALVVAHMQKSELRRTRTQE